MKILLLDIETAPLTVYAWGLWKQNINISHIIDSGYVMCWAAKWLGESELFFSSLATTTKSEMLAKIYALLEEADIVIHYNGDRFDLPTLNKEFLLEGYAPHAPIQSVDLLKTVKHRFRFPSNKLDFVAKALGCKGKYKHAGFQLWLDCMAGDAKAWQEMEVYNKNDVLLLEEVYKALLPWIKNHPNVAVYSNTPASCTHCGSSNLIRRGYRYTNSGKYARFRCDNCGSWSQAKSTESDKGLYKNVGS